MALITAPTLTLQSIAWSLDRPAQINVGITGKRTVDAPLYGKWAASVSLATVPDETSFLPIRSFLMRCFGAVNTFQLPATVESQNANSGVTVASTAAAGAVSMTLSGVTTALLDGQMVTVNGQLLQLTADQSGSTITFEPALRAAATATTAVETANPYAIVRLTSGAIGWTVSPPARFDVSFDVEEAY